MARVSVAHACTACGAHSPGPMGRCPRCGAWGTVEPADAQATPARGMTRHVPRVRLGEVEAVGLGRTPTGVDEVDRVLGGGWVAGGVVLLSGDPGIGKSTLLLQLAAAAVGAGHETLYVAGEESAAQVKLRADRLGVGPALTLTGQVDAHAVADHLRHESPRLAIVDSVQTLEVDGSGVPGSVAAVRDATALLTQAAKASGTTLVLIGHVTKQGTLAGPKTIEHVVDVTLSLEAAAGYRVLRAQKNRFGPSGEVGVFEMGEDGLRAVPNPSDAFLAERPEGVPGSVVAALLEGRRAIVVEVQALASASPYAAPRRVVQGIDPRRVDVVLAVLERRLELPLAGLDVYVNVAGGLRVTDHGADLAVAAAVASAVTNRPAPAGVALVGEIGLAGELRSVEDLERRRREAERAGFPTLVGPAGRARTGGASPSVGAAGGYRACRDLRGALDALWGPA